MSRRTRGTEGRTSWWDRVVLSFMGPPQLGEDRAPEGYVPDPQAELCHRCGLPWAEHERVHTGSMTYRRCPQG